MKQAIIILIHKDIENVVRLINYFKGTCDIFIHIDKDYKISTEQYEQLKKLDGVVSVFQTYKVHWGAFSIVKTELFLLETAIKKSKFKYVHLLSGQDYPIKPLSDFLRFFSDTDNEYLQNTHLPNPNWDNNTMQRLQNYFFLDHMIINRDSDVKKVWNMANTLAKYGLKRRIPDEFMHLYGGSQWFSLSREAIVAILEYTHKHSSFYRAMRFVYCPDEIYFTTVLMNIDYKNKKEIINDNMRFIKWPFKNAQHPKIINHEDLRLLAASNAFFARKFGKDHTIKDVIDKYYLKDDLSIFEQNGIIHQSCISKYGFDLGLAKYILYFCQVLNIKSIIDLGCGPGLYVDFFNKSNIITYGYDGNKYTTELSRIISQDNSCACKQLELHHPIDNIDAADLVLFLSVGEYIPSHYQDVVINNLCKVAKKYLVISWANVFNQDIYIQNPLKKREIEKELQSRGFELDMLATDSLRHSVNNHLHKNSYIFKRK